MASVPEWDKYRAELVRREHVHLQTREVGRLLEVTLRRMNRELRVALQGDCDADDVSDEPEASPRPLPATSASRTGPHQPEAETPARFG